jgi:hypothetical protein
MVGHSAVSVEAGRSRDSVGPVERCLACEAVVTRGYQHIRPFPVLRFMMFPLRRVYDWRTSALKAGSVRSAQRFDTERLPSRVL